MEGGTSVPKMGQGVLGDVGAFFTVIDVPKNIAFTYRRLSKLGDEKGKGWGKGIEQNHLKNLQCLSVSL